MNILMDALQHDTFFTRYSEAAQQLGITTYSVYPIPFSSYLLGLTPIFSQKNVTPLLTLGNVDIARRIREAVYPKQLDPEAPIPTSAVFDALKKSIFHDVKAFEQSTALEHGIPMFNRHGIVTSLSNIRIPGELDNPLFVKPLGDEKSFAGTVLFHGDNLEERMRYLNVPLDTKVIVAPFKKPKREYRCMMIGHTYITGSQYMVKGMLDISSIVPLEVQTMAEQLSYRYMPHEMYVVDIVETMEGTLEVMEYNMFNAAGPYACDVVAMLDAVRNHMSFEIDQTFAP